MNKKKEDKYITEFKELCFTGDIEIDHFKADCVLCKLLIELGYNKIIEVYDKVKKYYS